MPKVEKNKDVLKESIQLIEAPSKNTKRRILISINVIFFLAALLHMALNIVTFGKLPVPERDIPMYSFLLLWMALSGGYNFFVFHGKQISKRSLDLLSAWGTYSIVQALAIIIVHTNPNMPLGFLFDFSLTMVVIFVAGTVLNRKMAIVSFVIALLSMFITVYRIGGDFEYHLSTKEEMINVGKGIQQEAKASEALDLPLEQRQGIDKLLAGIKITSKWMSSAFDKDSPPAPPTDRMTHIGKRFQAGLPPISITLYAIVWLIFLFLVFFPIFFESGMLGEILSVIPLVIRNINEAAKEKQVLQKENMRMGAELDVAKQIQEMVLPKTAELKKPKGLDIASRMDAATEVGGDYYDVLPQSDGSVYFGIGDVTDHGLQSGVIMLMTQSAYRTCVAQKNVKLVDCLIHVNEVLYENIHTRMEDSRNLTLAFLYYKGGKLEYTGQHETMLLLKKNSKKVDEIKTLDLGIYVGLTETEDFKGFVKSKALTLKKGDTLLLYTDGVTEAENPDKAQYGTERLMKRFLESKNKPSKDIVDHIYKDIYQFIGSNEVYDDITMLVIRRES